MSAQSENVETIQEHLRHYYHLFTGIDGQVHGAIEEIRYRLLAQEMAEDPDVRADLELVRLGKVDFSSAVKPSVFVEAVRARHHL